MTCYNTASDCCYGNKQWVCAANFDCVGDPVYAGLCNCPVCPDLEVDSAAYTKALGTNNMINLPVMPGTYFFAFTGGQYHNN